MLNAGLLQWFMMLMTVNGAKLMDWLWLILSGYCSSWFIVINSGSQYMSNGIISRSR